MLQVKFFEYPNEELINEFLQTTNGQLIDIKYAESAGEIRDGRVIRHSTIMIVYEVSGPGGMKAPSSR